MKPVNFPEANIRYDKPASMSDLECSSIFALKEEDTITTVWQPSEDDKAAIAAGRPVILVVSGQSMPPIILATFGPNDEPNVEPW